MNWIWLGLVVVSVITAAFNGTMAAVTTASIDSAKSAVSLALGLVGVMAFWLGLMRIVQEGGLLHTLARALRPLMVRLFPDVPAEHPAMSAMIMNMASNMLGLGNAATPFGIKAMQELDRLNPQPALPPTPWPFSGDQYLKSGAGTAGGDCATRLAGLKRCGRHLAADPVRHLALDPGRHCGRKALAAGRTGRPGGGLVRDHRLPPEPGPAVPRPGRAWRRPTDLTAGLSCRPGHAGRSGPLVLLCTCGPASLAACRSARCCGTPCPPGCCRF